MAAPAETHVKTTRAALSSACDVKGVVADWVNDGRPDGAKGLRSRLEDAADPAPVARAVTDLRAAGAKAVK